MVKKPASTVEAKKSLEEVIRDGSHSKRDYIPGTGRRDNLKWSRIEKEDLLRALQLGREGKWKEMKSNPIKAFENRTTVDLKDKVRTLKKLWLSNERLEKDDSPALPTIGKQQFEVLQGNKRGKDVSRDNQFRINDCTILPESADDLTSKNLAVFFNVSPEDKDDCFWVKNEEKDENWITPLKNFNGFLIDQIDLSLEALANSIIVYKEDKNKFVVPSPNLDSLKPYSSPSKSTKSGSPSKNTISTKSASPSKNTILAKSGSPAKSASPLILKSKKPSSKSKTKSEPKPDPKDDSDMESVDLAASPPPSKKTRLAINKADLMELPALAGKTRSSRPLSSSSSSSASSSASLAMSDYSESKKDKKVVRKTANDSSAKPTSSIKGKRGRGRPPKSLNSSTTAKRGRGRPAKN